MNFIKRVLSTITGLFIFLFICFVGVLIIVFISNKNTTDTVYVKPNTVLKLKLDFPIKDYAGQTKFKDFEFTIDHKKNGLFDIIDAINFAATDTKIKGISIENNFIQAGLSQTKALRDALLNFKASGKFINAYADIYTQKDYYLCSVADTVYINPAGMMEFKGLYSERLYFKDFQEKSGLKMEVIRFGKYKSAVEPYLTNTMSAENREQISKYLNSIWGQIKKEIAISRHIPEHLLDNIADNLLARTPSRALKSKLIDKIAYQDQYISHLKKATHTAKDEKLSQINLSKYLNYVSQKEKSNTKNKIAVIFAEGEIIYGKGKLGSVGHITTNKALRQARKNKNVKAVVLRINSPGGSALASELIWREIELTKKVKPVIVSMGNVAASGGYYMACNANKIFAQPTTITGSIGVFGILPNAKNLADRWGVNAEQVVTNKNALTYSVLEPLNDNQRGFIKESIIDIYELFTQRVATGRTLDINHVKAIAQGRVWTGTDALNNKLIDEIGGLNDAVQYASNLSNTEYYKIKKLPIFEQDIEELMEQYGLMQSKENILIKELGVENYKVLKEIKAMSKRKGMQLLLPYNLDIK